MHINARIESALAPTFSEPAAPVAAAIKSERPRVGAAVNADSLSPVFEIATGDGAILRSEPGRLLASIDVPTEQATVAVAVQSARHVRSVSIDAVIVVAALGSDGARIELNAPFPWSLASAIENDLKPGREHHLQIVASATGIKTRLNGRLIAENDSPQVTDKAATLVAVEFSGIKGEIKDLSVTRERVLDDGRMRATLLASDEAELSRVQQQIADVMESPDDLTDDTDRSDEEALATTGQPAADGDTQAVPDATDAQATSDAEFLALDSDTPDAQVVENTENTDKSALNVDESADRSSSPGADADTDADALALDITPSENPGAAEPGTTSTAEAVNENPAAVNDIGSVSGKGEATASASNKDDQPSLGLFEMAGLDEASLEVKPDAPKTLSGDGDSVATAESGPAPPIDGVQEPDDAPVSPPDYEGVAENSADDASKLQDADNFQETNRFPEEQSILETGDQYANNDRQLDGNGYNENEGIFSEDNLPDSYQPESVGSGYIEPLTNQDPLLQAIQNQQEQALLAQQSGAGALDESHSPSEPEVSDEEQEDGDPTLVEDEQDTITEQSTSTPIAGQTNLTDSNNVDDGSGSDTDGTTTGTSNPTPVVTSVPGFGLPTPQSPVQPAVTNFFAFDPATAQDVIAWYRLDGSLSDLRGVLSPLSSRGTSFDSDSFDVPGEPGNQRVRVEDSGDQLLGSVDVQLLNFVGVTQRISISAMIYVNEWQSSFLSSPTILQFGGNSGPGISLVDSSQGRQIVGNGDVVFDSGTVDAVLTEQVWHHVRIDLTNIGYEFRVDGSLVGQIEAPDDLAEWDAIGNATVRVGNLDGFVDEIIIISANGPAVTTTPTDGGSGTPPTTGSGDDGSDPTVGDPVDDSVVLVSYPLSENFADVTANAPEFEVNGNVQFSVATPTRTTGALATTQFTSEGDELFAPLPFDNLITEPLEKLVFEAEFRLTDWDASVNVPVLQIVADGSAWFSFAWDPNIGPDMAAAQQPLAEGETLQQIFEDNDWHRISFSMTPEECSVSIDEQTIATVPCVGAIEGWPAPNTELVLGNFNGYIRSVEIRAIEDN